MDVIIISMLAYSSEEPIVIEAMDTYNNDSKLILNGNDPVRIVWSEDKESIVHAFEKTVEISSPIEVTGNTCSNTIGQKCFVVTNIRTVGFAILWSKNPDDSKIGRPVYRANTTMTTTNEEGVEETKYEDYEILTADRTAIFSSDVQSLYPDRNKTLEQTYIKCDDYSWVPGNSNSRSLIIKDLKVANWGLDFMLPNFETGITENRSLSAGVNLHFKSDEVLKLQSLDAFVSEFADIPFLSVGSTAHLAILSDDGNSCQVSLKLDGINQFANLFSAHLEVDYENDPSVPFLSNDVILYSDVFNPIHETFRQFLSNENRGLR